MILYRRPPTSSPYSIPLNKSELEPVSPSTLASYRAIAVTGPQRSGTTIASHILADTLNFRQVDEDTFDVVDYGMWLNYLTVPSRVVVHCPSMSFALTDTMHLRDIAIVFLYRPEPEIEASVKRINLNQEREYLRYKSRHASFMEVKRTMAGHKYHIWEWTQEPFLPNTFRLYYHDMESHPMWVRDRSSFAPRQWQSGQS